MVAVDTLERRLCFATTFASAVSLAAGAPVDFIDTADFNSDGKRDVVMSSYAGRRLSLLLGNGDGTFAPRQDLGQTVAPDFVTAADVNNDGKTDLITVSYDDAMVRVLLGNGDGSFQSAVAYSAGAGPRSAAIGDYTGDGKPDILVAQSFTKSISLLRNNGNGTFQSPSNTSLSFTPVDVVPGDFDSDGKLDFAAADYFTNKVGIVRGNGNGTFATPTVFSTGSGPASICAGDLDGDGKLDVATANFAAGTVTVLRGDGTGSLSAMATLTAGSGATYVLATDLDGNGTLDLATANANSDRVSVFFNSGTGTFSAATNYTVGDSPRALAVANFNGGGLDLVVANQGTDAVSLLLGNGAVFPPTANAGSGYTVNEGGTVQLSGLASTGSDLTYEWDLDNDGIYGESGTAAKRGDEVGPTPLFSAVGVDGPDTRTVRLRVTDANGLSDLASAVITVGNVAPTLTISGPSAVGVGAVYTLGLSANDPGIDEISAWTINWGDGTTSVIGNIASTTKTYSAAGSFNITASGTDEDGTYASNSLTVSVIAAPVARANGPYAVNEAGNVQLTAGGSTGTGLTYAWDLDQDGIFGETGAAAKRGDEVGATPVFSAATIDGPDSRTPVLRVTDSIGQTSTSSAVVWIQNVAPTLTISGASSVGAGSIYVLSLSSSDPGPDTITAWTINWGDGSSSTTGNVASITKTFATAGNYSITASATDEDGTYSSNTRNVSVTAAPDTTPPTATLAPVATVTVDGTPSTTLTVTYSDDSAINPASIGSGDILVTGVNGFTQLASFVSIDGAVATYRVDAAGGAWDYADNGAYVVTLQAAQVSDEAGNFASVATLGSFDVAVPLPDSAGNTPEMARSFRVLSAGTIRVAEDGVGASDRNDFFRFTLDTSLNLSIKLSNLSEKADLYLLDSSGATLVSSRRGGASDETISETLSAGTYYVRVAYAGAGGYTFYRLRAEANLPPLVDPGILAAIDTGLLDSGAVKVATGNVSPGSANAHYRFSLAETSQVYVKLTELTANADLQILDSSGNVLASSGKSGTRDEAIRLNLAAGTFYVKITLKASVATNFRLRLANETV